MSVAVSPVDAPVPSESRSTDRRAPRNVERLALQAVARQTAAVVQDFTDLLDPIHGRLVLDQLEQGEHRPENRERVSDAADLAATLMAQLRMLTGPTLETERVDESPIVDGAFAARAEHTGASPRRADPRLVHGSTI